IRRKRAPKSDWVSDTQYALYGCKIDFGAKIFFVKFVFFVVKQRLMRDVLLNTEIERDNFGGECSEDEEDYVSEVENDSESHQEINELEDELEDPRASKRRREVQERELEDIPLFERLQ
ncbi:hypothetical protein PV325_007657, partial [Microctonus aethiopoides]